jgi:hypothetical protein
MELDIRSHRSKDSTPQNAVVSWLVNVKCWSHEFRLLDTAILETYNL